MNKSELIKQLSEKAQISLEEADIMVNSLIRGMKHALMKEGRVEIRGFCSFSVRNYDAYVGSNPKTGEPMNVSSKSLPFYKPGKELKDFLNDI